jgi:putative oxidoreductase
MVILTWIIQGLLGLAFLMAGLGKITGSKMHIEGFEHWRLPQWFRVVTGIVESVAAVLLIGGFWMDDLALYGAIILAATGVGGVITHLRVKDGLKEMMPIFVLGFLAIILVFLLV